MSAFILRVDAKENDVKIGIFTALFGDWPLSQVASHVADLGYEAVELPGWAGNPHLDLSQVLAGAGEKVRKLLSDRGLSLSAIKNGVAGQLSMGPHGSSTSSSAPGMSTAEKVAYAREEILKTARAASELEVPVVTRLIGTHVWDKWYIFPPANEKLYEGYDYVISFEHEDPVMSPEDGAEKAITYLRPLIIKKPLTRVWW